MSSEDLPETSTLEYKEIPHDIKLHRCEFYKDILSLLNSSEFPDEDRFLVYGVKDQERTPCGYDRSKGNDDATYQQLFEKISPRPTIQFADIEASRILDDEKLARRLFGFFFIPSSNFGKVYEMAEGVSDDIPPDDSSTRQNALLRKRKSISEGASFTRNGSRVRPLMQSDRTRILEFKKQPETPTRLVDASTFAFDARGTSIFALAAIFGSWDETLPGDIQAIEAAAKMKYEEWITPLRELRANEPSILAVEGSVWTIPSRVENIRRCSEHLTLAQLHEIQPTIGSILSTVDPKYDLPADSRFAAAIYGRANPCSTGMRQGVAEFLAIIGTAAVELPHCDRRAVDRFVSDTMKQIICTTDWRVLASADSEFPLLAEASPDLYLALVECAYDEGGSLGDFLKQAPSTFGVSNGYGLFTGVQYAAQDPKTFAKAMSLLEKLHDTTPLAAQAIESVLLPWRPETRADIQTRIAMGRRLADKGCWKSLLKLLPGATRTAIPIPTPRYLPAISFDEPVKMDEYRQVSQEYTEVAIDAAEGNADRIIDLLGAVNSIDMAGEIPRFAELLNRTQKHLTDADTFRVWNELEILLRRYRTFGKDNELVDHDGYALLGDAARALKPDDPYLIALFLFTHATYSLASNTESRASGNEVEDEREKAIDALYKSEGTDALKRLALNCTERRSLGASASAIVHSEDAILEVIDWLSNEKSLEETFAGFVTGIYINDAQSCLDLPRKQNWSAQKTAIYYAHLSCEPRVWKAVENTLGTERASLYWQIAPPCLSVDSVAEAEYAISMYTSQERYGVATTYAGLCISQGLELDACVVDKALQGLSPIDAGTELSEYYLSVACSYLDARHPTEALAWKEFEWLPLLRNAGALYPDSNLHLFKLMSQSPEFFIAILSLLYSKDCDESNKDQVKSIKERAFEVLNAWRVVPGSTEDEIDHDESDSWLLRVNELASDAGLINQASHAIGRCFLHAPADVDGLFIDKGVAKYLDQDEHMLNGYSEEAVNSQGAIWVGEHGESLFEIARNFDVKATELEHAGFMQFAAAIRNLAREYEMDGKREQKEEQT
ncbi:RNA-binding domain-containing protein [Olsenella phocaeensis]|uniref:RNA-binding domain-containing protein n=1 Tax=Olsenella phocaeensis TaxID=1852385 RepID=UPI003A930E70